jgi:hypothetical protein
VHFVAAASRGGAEQQRKNLLDIFYFHDYFSFLFNSIV